MANILNMDYRIDYNWCYEEYKKYIKPNNKVVVLAFSFRETEIKNNKDWESYYSKTNGQYYQEIVDSYKRYGVNEENIVFINYFNHSQKDIIEYINSSDIIYLPGGIPTGFYEKIEEFNLTNTIKEYKGVIIGCSAGAMIQMDEYFISPDKDYSEFGYYKGLGLLAGFGIEAHYDNSITQNEAIKKYLEEKKNKVYAIKDNGALIIENGVVRIIGEVREISNIHFDLED